MVTSGLSFEGFTPALAAAAELAQGSGRWHLQLYASTAGGAVEDHSLEVYGERPGKCRSKAQLG